VALPKRQPPAVPSHKPEFMVKFAYKFLIHKVCR
jgi:hypothetical protein